jgi:hypothetical protein
MAPKVVVLTPVRNEAWILDRFLSASSTFADLIIVADQNSSDGSRNIYPKYPKVVVVENPSAQYDEASRQQLLLAEARARVPWPRLLLALDADEVVAADGVGSRGWRAMLAAAPGTVLWFEKPDVLPSFDRCVRYNATYPLGYVDDGAAHAPRFIHSYRIPIRPHAPRLDVMDVKVLHYAYARPIAYRARQRMYAALEVVRRNAHLLRRRHSYAAGRDVTAGHRVEPVDPAWLAGWERLGIDLRFAPEEQYSWHDFEVLRLFAAHGVRRFWLDDLWDIDWEACRAQGLAKGEPGMPRARVCPPPAGTRILASALDSSFRTAQRLRRTFIRRP